MGKVEARLNEATGKWELFRHGIDDADSYVALTNKRHFIVTESAQEAEDYLVKEGGGTIYALTHYQHNDEVLPQSNFYKEVVV